MKKALLIVMLLVATTHADPEGQRLLIERLTAEVDQLHKEVDDLKAENAALKKKIGIATAAPVDLADQSARLKKYFQKALRLPIITDQSMRIGDSGLLSFGSDFRVTQIIDTHNLLASYGEQRIWLQNFSTDGIVDGTVLEMKFPVYVIGTKQYDTKLAGKRTVFLIEPIPLDDELRGMIAAHYKPK